MSEHTHACEVCERIAPTRRHPCRFSTGCACWYGVPCDPPGADITKTCKEGVRTMSRQPSKARAEIEGARDRLRELCPPGTTVYTVLRHVSASGMSRDIAVYVMDDGEPRWITWTVAQACGMRWNDAAEAIRIGGAGMDMGFALVYDLSHTLYPNGFACVGSMLDLDRRRDCPSNEHSNGMREYGPDIRHESGGYALRHRWL